MAKTVKMKLENKILLILVIFTLGWLLLQSPLVQQCLALLALGLLNPNYHF